MNHDPTEIRMRELSWRRHLTAAEQAELSAWLAAHPESALNRQEETALNTLLDRLPDAPISSNFTARVMHDIEREAAAASRQHAPTHPWWQRVLLPRLAFAAVVVGAGLFVYQRNAGWHQAQVAEGLRAVPKELLSVEVLKDFDAIAQLGPRVQPDKEILSLLQ